MSDWAAKLSQKPASGQGQSSQKPHVQTSSGNSTSVNTAAPSGQQKPQIHPSSHVNPQSKTRTSKPQRQESPPRSGSVSPEPFNGAEILAWLSKRYGADLDEVHADKSGDNALIYRSLEASSSWKTKGPSSGRKHTKEDDRFDLVSEINRTFQPKIRRY
ncbi:hypothetical protein JCM33374_g2979 [Metschnikowia sp. JCM 33374]|nr:hypothetical protein JCM33374_g2979 [Metschnikowia sp. JCM 33374]